MNVALLTLTLIIAAEPDRDAQLHGAWKLKSPQYEGKIGHPRLVSWLTFSRIDISDQDGQYICGYNVDTSKTPHQINLSFSGRVAHGIYLVQDGTLTICMAGFGKPRPMDFISGEDNEFRVTVLKRE